MSTEEQTQDRHPRRRTLAVASVAAAVLLAGGGGAYFAAQNTSGGGGEPRTGGAGGDGTPPPLALDGYAQGGGPGTTNGIAPGEPDPNGTRYRASGDLPEGPGKAPVYRAEGQVTAAEVAALAKALDVDGTPELQGGTWRSGPAKDGSGPSLQVTREAPGTWTYARYAPSAGNKCAGGTKCADPATGGSEKDAVSEAEAKETAAPLLEALGEDDAALDATQLMGATRVVNADPEIGGLPTYGWSTGIQIGPDGQISGGSGQLKAPVKGATYPTVGAKETIERLNSSAAGDRASVGGCASAVPLDGAGSGSAEQGAGCAPSSPRPPASTTVEVSKATFGLAAHYVRGRQALVPSWLFQVEPAGQAKAFTVTHPAVEPRFLAAPKSPAASSSPASPSASAGPGSQTSDVRVQGYRGDGRTLTLHFTGGVCATYAASAKESGDEVTVRVTATEKKGTVCVEMAKYYTLPVTLDAPLGDRDVVRENGGTVPLAEKNGPGGASPAPRD